MEKVSLDVMKDLEHQSNVIRGTNNKIISMNREVDQGNSLINSMLRRENRNKLIIIMMVIALSMVLGIMLYVKIF